MEENDGCCINVQCDDNDHLCVVEVNGVKLTVEVVKVNVSKNDGSCTCGQCDEDDRP